MSSSSSSSSSRKKREVTSSVARSTNKDTNKHNQSCKIATKRKSRKSSSTSTLHQPPFDLFPQSSSSSVTEKTFDKGIESVVKILEGKKNVVVLVGAGISVSCGIPDFRSKDTGIYHTMDANELGLSTPEELFHLECFQDDPRPFYKFATKMLYPIKPIEPSPSHHFLSLLERKKILLRVYTQNIDGLEEKAGVSSKKIVYAHGSMNTSSCLKCGQKASADELRQEILKGNIPYCKRILNKNRKRKRKEVVGVHRMNGVDEYTENNMNDGTRPLLVKTRRSRSSSSNVTESSQSCNLRDDANVQVRTCNGVMKPNITFFGEQLVDRVKKCLEADRKKADAVIVIGTSLSVAPMSKIIEYLSPCIPRILINRTIVIPKHGTYCEDGKQRYTDDSSNDDGDRDHRNDFVFDACLLGFCDEVTKSLIDLMSSKNRSKHDRIKSVSEKASTSQGPNDFDVLCNLPNLRGVLNEQSLFRHPHDRIFLYPGTIINKNDVNTADNDESTEIVFEEIVHCDECHAVIKCVVMKCTECFDFDLCQDCYTKISKVHFSGHHKFVAEEL